MKIKLSLLSTIWLLLHVFAEHTHITINNIHTGWVIWSLTLCSCILLIVTIKVYWYYLIKPFYTSKNKLKAIRERHFTSEGFCLVTAGFDNKNRQQLNLDSAACLDRWPWINLHIININSYNVMCCYHDH